MRRLAILWASFWIFLLAGLGHSSAAEEVTPVQEVLSNPAKFHRHVVVLQGALKLVGRWEGKDVVGIPTCGSIFKLQDDTGEIPIFYIIRCDPQEEGRIAGMGGGRVTVSATIQSDPVVVEGAEYHTRAMGSTIRLEGR
jgi:hypothetical protein